MRSTKHAFKIKNQKKRIAILYASFPLLFYLSNLFRMTQNISVLYRLSIYIFGTIGILCFVFSRKWKKEILIFSTIYFLGGIFNILIIGNLTFSDIAADIFLFGITYLMLAYRSSYIQGVASFYITFFTFLFFYRRGINTHFILSSSGNYISVLLIISASLYYISLQQSGRKIFAWDVIPAILSFALSVWAKGRGGILSTGILVVLMTFQLMYQMTNKKAKNILKLFIAFFSIVTFILISDFSVINWFFSLGKWSYRGVDNSDRIYIWNSYFAKVVESIFYILFGAPLDQINVISRFGGNCHNSFIQLHAYNGLITFITFSYYLGKCFIFYIRTKQWIIASVVLVFCLRAFSDKFIFGQYGMPLMLFFIMNPYYGKGKVLRDSLGKNDLNPL